MNNNNNNGLNFFDDFDFESSSRGSYPSRETGNFFTELEEIESKRQNRSSKNRRFAFGLSGKITFNDLINVFGLYLNTKSLIEFFNTIERIEKFCTERSDDIFLRGSLEKDFKEKIENLSQKDIELLEEYFKKRFVDRAILKDFEKYLNNALEKKTSGKNGSFGNNAQVSDDDFGFDFDFESSSRGSYPSRETGNFFTELEEIELERQNRSSKNPKFYGKVESGETFSYAARNKENDGSFDDSVAKRFVSPEESKQETAKKILIDYPSVVSFIETMSRVSILEKYQEALLKIYKESNSIENYIKKSNMLIYEILLYLTLDNDQVVNMISEQFGLTFSVDKSSTEIVEELIGDELRFYQQQYLPRNLNMNSLGNSRILKKNIMIQDEKQEISFSFIRYSDKTCYKFNSDFFENNSFFIHSSDGEGLSSDRIAYEIIKKLYDGDASELDIIYSDGKVNVVKSEMDVNRGR